MQFYRWITSLLQNKGLVKTEYDDLPAAADRVKQQQGLSRDPYDRDDDARQVGSGGSDARQVRGGAVFSLSTFGGHLLAGDCILALLFSLFPASILSAIF
jgi:hypothetical protein